MAGPVLREPGRARIFGRPRRPPLTRERFCPLRHPYRSARGLTRAGALLACVLAAGSCGGERGDSRAAPLLRWGGDAEGGAPFVEADPADPSVVRGFDVEIAELIAGELGREARFVQVAWASIVPSVERGDVEIGLAGQEDSPELRERYSVTIPYFEFYEVIAVRHEDADRFRTLDDLAGRRVGTLGGTTAYDILLEEQARTGVVPVSYDDDVHPYEDLAAGRVDAVLLDHVIAERSRIRSNDAFLIQPEAVATGHYVGVLSSRDAALRDSVDRAIRSAMLDGRLEQIFRGWQVWDERQAAYYQRVLSEEPAAGGGASGRPVRDRSLGAYAPALLRAALVTVAVSCLSMLLAVLVGSAVAAGRVYGPRWLGAALTAWVEVTRGTPVLLQLFVIYYGLAGVVRLPAFAAAVIGLGLNYAAYESEIYRAALQAIPRAQLEAARTLGLSEGSVLRLVRAPQALRLTLAPMTNDFVALLKDSSLVSVITVVELTKQTAIYATNVGSWVIPGTVCALMYLALSLPLSRLARRLERRWSVA